jgi:hypothetical protein
MHTKLLAGFLMIVALGLSSDSVFAQGRSAVAEAQRITGDRFTFVGRTPNGANIYSVRRPSGCNAGGDR